MKSDLRPIGVFDSGVGGLSILNQLIQSFPNESFVYLGDTARLPYGSKSPQTIQKYVTQNINYLIKTQKIKAIVVACNSASTVLADIKIQTDIPIFGTIKPGATSAYKSSKNKKIAIWATRATVNQKSYKKELISIDPLVQSYSIACPLLVPLVEEGLWEGPITDSIIDMYLEEIKKTDVDTLILGCTHYPFIQKSIQKRIDFLFRNKKLSFKKIFSNTKQKSNLKIIDSANAIADELKNAFKNEEIIKSTKASDLNLLLTDEASHFMDLVLKAFPNWKNIKFQLIDLQQIV